MALFLVATCFVAGAGLWVAERRDRIRRRRWANRAQRQAAAEFGRHIVSIRK